MTAITMSALLATMVVTCIIPAATALVTKCTASTGVKQLVTAALAAVSGVVVAATTTDGSAVLTKTALVLALGQFIGAQASYRGLYKPHDADAKIAPTFGLGAS